jgi:transposase
LPPEQLGRSRGGFGTKGHLAVDARGQPVEFRLGPGQEHDSTRAAELLAEHAPKTVIADKGDDADELVATIRPSSTSPPPSPCWA